MLITATVTPTFGRHGPSLQQTSRVHLKRDFQDPFHLSLKSWYLPLEQTRKNMLLPPLWIKAIQRHNDHLMELNEEQVQVNCGERSSQSLLLLCTQLLVVLLRNQAERILQ